MTPDKARGRFWFGWPARGRKNRQPDLSDLLEPLLTCEDEADLLDGLPCCCLASNGRGTHAGACRPDCGTDEAAEPAPTDRLH